MKTPCFIFYEKKILENLKFINNLKDNCEFTHLYSIKSLSNSSILNTIIKQTEGFSVSSLFEAGLARAYSLEKKIHFVSPAIKESEIKRVDHLCDRITFNSLGQFQLLKDKVEECSRGIRINPELSYLSNDRYDPCRKYSKLGVPITDFKNYLEKEGCGQIEGLHIHTNCESTDFSELIKTVDAIEKKIGKYLHKIKWFNLGGGYLFKKESKHLESFINTVSRFRKKYNLEMIIEPGNSTVKDTGELVASVLDVLERNGKRIAILDTSVNHLPEVFEYQYEPEIKEHSSSFKNNYILAGRSCLAGDVFGEYKFKEKLEVGDRITFGGVGSYSLVKAHMFNGINLPTIYYKKQDGSLKKIKEYSFEDYLQIHHNHTQKEELNPSDADIITEKVSF